MTPDEVEVRGVRDDRGRLIGTEVRHGARVYTLPQWPKRVNDVEVNGDNSLTVHFESGHSRLLEAEDALS